MTKGDRRLFRVWAGLALGIVIASVTLAVTTGDFALGTTVPSLVIVALMAGLHAIIVIKKW